MDLTVRPAERSDAAVLLTWRNDEASRRWSRTPTVVAPEQHAYWLDAVLGDPDRLLWVLLAGDRPVASVRHDIDLGSPSVAEVSIGVDPSQRGAGVATKALAMAEDQLRRVRPDVRRLRAVVHRDNQVSRRLFVQAGYVLRDAEEPGWLSFIRVVEGH